MIKIFSCRIKRAHGLGQQHLYLRFQSVIVSRENSFLNRNRRRLRNHVPKPLKNLFIIHKCDLTVWQGNFAHNISTERRHSFQDFQVSGHQKETVNGRWIAPDLRINHSCINIGGESFPIDQRSQTTIDLLIRLRQDLPDNVIAASGYPVRSRLTFAAEIADY